jgi:hypothetical protein
MVSYILSKYAPAFLKSINIDVSNNQEGEVMAK